MENKQITVQRDGVKNLDAAITESVVEKNDFKEGHSLKNKEETGVPFQSKNFTSPAEKVILPLSLPSMNTLIASAETSRKNGRENDPSKKGAVKYVMNHANHQNMGGYNRNISMNPHPPNPNIPYYPSTSGPTIYHQYFGNTIQHNLIGASGSHHPMIEKGHMMNQNPKYPPFHRGLNGDQPNVPPTLHPSVPSHVPPKKRNRKFIPPPPFMPPMRSNNGIPSPKAPTYSTSNGTGVGNIAIHRPMPPNGGNNNRSVRSNGVGRRSRRKRKYFRRNVKVEDILFSREEIVQLFGRVQHNKGMLPVTSTTVLREWFCNHLESPYPTREEKENLVRQSGLKESQVSNWFTNQRKRIWKPYVQRKRDEQKAMSKMKQKSSMRNNYPINSSSKSIVYNNNNKNHHETRDGSMSKNLPEAKDALIKKSQKLRKASESNKKNIIRPNRNGSLNQ